MKIGGPYTNVFGNPLLPGGQAERIRVPFADTNLITHRLPLARAPEGYRTFANHEEDVLKVVLKP